MGQLLTDLGRFAVRPVSLLAMTVLLGFSVGYSIFIGEMTRGGGSAAAMRFAGLNQLFGVLSATLVAVIVFVLSRRFVHDDEEVAASRLGAFVALSFGLFLIIQFVQLIWQPLLLMTMPVGDEWLATAMRVPALVLAVLLFPLGVWRVGLACGARRPTFAETWALVWKTQRPLIAGAFLLAASSLVLLQVMQPLATSDAGLPRVVGLTLLLGPSAVMTVLQTLLMIIAFRRIVPAEGQRVADVFA